MIAAVSNPIAPSAIAAARRGYRCAICSPVMVTVGVVALATLTKRKASLLVMRPIRARVAAGLLSALMAESLARPRSRREHSARSAVIRMMLDCTRRSSVNSRSRSRRMSAVLETKPRPAVLVMP